MTLSLSAAQLKSVADQLFLLKDPAPARLTKPANTTGAKSLVTKLDPLATDVRFTDMGIAVVDFTADKAAPRIWLHNGDDAWRVGSTAKIAVLLAAVQLRDDVRRVKDLNIVSTPADFDELFAMSKLWGRSKDSKIRQIAGKGRSPRISTVLDVTQPTVKFSGPDPDDTPDIDHIIGKLPVPANPAHAPHLTWAAAPDFGFSERFWLMGARSDNVAATSCISEIGVDYLKAIQRAYGLFDPINGMHLLLSGPYSLFDATTSWMRLEPRSRNAEMNTSLQARIYDPLWLMTRQWQLGEFQGEDNGSPVMSRWRGESGRLTRYHGGTITPNSMVSGSSYDTRRTPLETMVERERVRPAPDRIAAPEKLRLAAEAGQQFLRMLGQQPLSRDYRPAFVRQYPFPALTPDQRAGLDADSLGFFDLMAGRVADGRRLYADFHPTGGGGPVIPAALQIAPADLAEVKNAAGLWAGWYEALFSEPDAANASWLPERLEYAFSVGARLSDGERVLTSPEYSEGRLDWYDFDLNLEVSLGGAADNAMTDVVGTAIPAPVSFRGMASPRFWEFEDAQVNFGAVDAGPTDLVRMLLVEFALAYGNDWFVIPVELPIGSLYRTRSLVITDTFGVRTLIQPSSELPAPHSEWCMFQQSHTRGSGLPKPAANLFFLAPAVIKSLESAPVEEVLFLRDEMANLAWGVERLVESASEQPLNRFEAAEEKRRRSPEPPAPVPLPSGTLRYRLSTEIPEYWVPLMPVRVGQGLRLRRGAVLKPDGTQEAVHAMGRLLTPEPGKPLELFEEEVPREGVRVSRNYQYTRWFDGSTHLWIGRRKQVGRGEGSSGLRFDGLGAV